MDLDQVFYVRAVGRILRILLVIGAAGALAAFVLGGWSWGAGFLAGAGASYLNFHWLRQTVESLGRGAPPKPRVRAAILLGLRYLLLASGAYAILRFSSLSLPAALVGLFVAVAAVIAEIIFELIYAGT